MAASVGMLMMLISMFVFDHFDLAMYFVTVNIISTSSLNNHKNTLFKRT